MQENPSYGNFLHDLLVIKKGGGLERIDSAAGWQEKRNDIIRRFIGVIGDFPSEVVPLAPETIDETDCGDYVRRKVSYHVAEGEAVKAYLLIPKNLGPPAPAVLCLHGTYEEAKDAPAGITGNPERSYAEQLVKRGYVALAPDHLASGERKPSGLRPYDTAGFYRKYPTWSAVGKTIWDGGRAIDYLSELDFVDPERIGSIGHSLGGHSTIFIAAMDERVVAAVSSCGLTTFAEDPRRLEWARDEWYIFMPKLRPIFLRGERAPFDWHEIVSLIAPRAFLNISALNDRCFPKTDALAELGIKVNKIYRLLGAEERFANFLHGSGHGFGAEARELAYAWLDRWLGTNENPKSQNGNSKAKIPN